MHASLLPTANDLAGLVAYVLGNPYLFISSSTVMTTGLVLGAVAVSMVPRSAPVMRVVAPPLAMLLVYFGAGSMILATEILIRFHESIPEATETQFASGIGLLLEAAAARGIAARYVPEITNSPMFEHVGFVPFRALVERGSTAPPDPDRLEEMWHELGLLEGSPRLPAAGRHHRR